MTGTAIDPAQIGGKYGVSITSPDGSLTQGTLTLTQQGEAWRAAFASPDLLAGGAAFLVGDQLVVGVGGAGCSVFAYQRAPDGALNGRWAMMESALAPASAPADPTSAALRLGDETAQRQPPGGAPPRSLWDGIYTISGHAPGSATLYLGQMTITSAASGPTPPDKLTFLITRDAGSAAIAGVGLSSGVAFGAVTAASRATPCTLLMFSVLDDGTFDGRLLAATPNADGTQPGLLLVSAAKLP